MGARGAERIAQAAKESARAAQVMLAMLRHTRISFKSKTLFPGGIGGGATLTAGQHNEEIADEMKWRAGVCAAIAQIEERAGVSLPIPAEVNEEDLRSIGVASAALTNGEGTATFGRVTIIVDRPAEIPGLPERFQREHSRRRTVSHSIFGREIALGEADYEFPKVKIVEVIPHGSSATAPARVILEPDGDPQVRFSLVDWKPDGSGSGRSGNDTVAP